MRPVDAVGGRLDRDELIAYCLTKPEAWQDFPFDESTLVIKVATRMFALFGLERPVPAATLRCEKEDVPEWRSRYPDSIGPAPYMPRKPWNLVLINGTVDPDDLRELVDISYDSVVARLPKRLRPTGWVIPKVDGVS